MITTFARIAKILKGLVEPRNWVEEAFSGIDVEKEKFHIMITGTASTSGNVTNISIEGTEAAYVRDTLMMYNKGDKGIIEFVVNGKNKIFPAFITTKGFNRIYAASSTPVLETVSSEDGSFLYSGFQGSTTKASGTFSIYSYKFSPTVEEA